MTHELLAQVNVADVKAGLARLLPILKLVAATTPNKYDDAAVDFLEKLLAASDAA